MLSPPSVVDVVVHVEAEALEVVVLAALGELELHQRRVIVARQRRARRDQHAQPQPRLPPSMASSATPLIGRTNLFRRFT